MRSASSPAFAAALSAISKVTSLSIKPVKGRQQTTSARLKASAD